MNATAKKIDDDVLTVLSASRMDGAKLFLPGTQLDRKLYVAVNAVLEAAGGKWNRSAKAHVFDGDASEVIEPIVLTGEYTRAKQDFGQFDTPQELAERLVDVADVRAGMSVLEPSAGVGNIARAAVQCGAHVTCWEIDQKRAERIQGAASLNIGDFLTATPPETFKFDRVVMNPPFAGQADIHHVRHAHRFLIEGGRLASIMSASVMFRDNRLTTEFRDFVAAHGGSIERLPDGSFRESGTMVNTCLVTITA